MRRRRCRGYRGSGPVALSGAAVLAIVAGVPAASGGQDTGARRVASETPKVSYDCETESGRRDMRIRVAMSLPESGSVGVPITPTGVTVDMTPGEPVGTELAERGVSSVLGVARLDVEVGESGAQAESGSRVVQFFELGVPATPLPRSGPLTLTATSPVSLPPQARRRGTRLRSRPSTAFRNRARKRASARCG